MPLELVINYFRYQDDQLKQVEKQGKPRFKVPGVYERAYWFDGNQNPMTMQRCDVCLDIIFFINITFQVLQSKIFMQLRDDDVPF